MYIVNALDLENLPITTIIHDMAPITISKGSGFDSTTRSASKRLNDPSKTDKVGQAPDEDLEAIGRHCEFEYCHQLDFLPFRCESCRKTFCLDHRTESAHKCSKEGEWARRKRNQNNNGRGGTELASTSTTQKPNIYNSNQCAHVSCKTFVDTVQDPGVRCPNCNRQYCLRHRLQEQHDCANIAPLGGRASNSYRAGVGNNNNNPTNTIRSMFAKVRSPFGSSSENSHKGTCAASSRTGSSVAGLNAIKRTAKGDASVPADRRLYLHVVGTSDTQKTEPPEGNFYFDSRWKVGRVLDDSARRLHVENLNNRGGGEEARLRVFHVETGEFLEFSDGIGAGKVKNGHTIVLLRGAGVLLGKS